MTALQRQAKPTVDLGLALEVLLAQAVNPLNPTVMLDHALGSTSILLEADQILQHVPTVLVQLITISQAATSLAHLAQSRMLL